MKTKIKIISLFLMLCTVTCIAPQKASAQGGSVNFQVFYDELSPYGTWVENPDYGYVWVPNVAPGFTPYATNGYWVFTDEGWTWVSNYSWGWAPFHYGRWYTDPNYGPMWVPDNEWGPGWVTWRRSGGYYGWAPIGPGVSISVAYSNNYEIPYNRWTFVRDRHFGRRDIHNYYVNSSNNVTIINNSTVINNIREDNTRHVRYNPGPDRTEVEKHAGRKFTPVAIKESSKPGQTLSKNQLQIYRPQVQKTISTGPKPAPSKVVNLKDMKAPAQRKAETPPQKTNQPPKQQPAQQQHQAQPPKQQPAQQQHQAQPPKQQQQAQPPKQQQQAQPTKQQPSQQQRQSQPPKQQQQAQPPKQQQPTQQQHQAQPPKQQQPSQQQRQAQPPKQQQQAQPPKQQQPSQQQRQTQPPKQQQQAQPPKQQQPSQQQHQAQPPKQQPSQQQHKAQPAKQQPSQPKETKPPKNMGV